LRETGREREREREERDMQEKLARMGIYVVIFIYL
jgi:hypothetical protein